LLCSDLEIAEVVIQANIFCAAAAVQEVVMQQGSLIRSKRTQGQMFGSSVGQKEVSTGNEYIS